MMRQLSCGISNDDFDEKPTKPSPTIQSSPTETSQSLNNYKISSTKSSLWSSNTIDYSATRHRRGTENTANPTTITSTTSVHISSPTTTPATGQPPVSPLVAHVESSASPAVTADPHKSLSDKSLGVTSQGELNTPESNSQTVEVQAEVAVTTEFRTEDGEYPGAISQGHLLSILENGTIFDILELNETVMELGTTSEKDLKWKSTSSSEDLFTTVQYHKEPPSENVFVTNNGLKKVGKSVKKQITPTEYSSWDTAGNTEAAKSTSEATKIEDKSTDLFPITGSSLAKLNRTNRKELPPMIETNETAEHYDSKDNGEVVDDSFMIPKHVDSYSDVDKRFVVNTNPNPIENRHQVVEIKIAGPTDSPHLNKKIYITTKLSPPKAKRPKKPDETYKKKKLFPSAAKPEITQETPQEKPEQEKLSQEKRPQKPSLLLIDPKIDELNFNLNITKTNNESEDITSGATSGVTSSLIPAPHEEAAHVVKKQFLPKSSSTASGTEKPRSDVVLEISSEELEGAQTDAEAETEAQPDTEAGENEIPTEDPIEPVPQQQPRRNRARTFTRRQRTSIYPHFFSRVLG